MQLLAPRKFTPTPPEVYPDSPGSLPRLPRKFTPTPPEPRNPRPGNLAVIPFLWETPEVNPFAPILIPPRHTEFARKESHPVYLALKIT